MASAVLFALFVTVILRAVSSQPVAQGLKSVNKTNATADASAERNKRELIQGNNSCAQGEMWLLDICVSIVKHNELKADDYDEITTASQDENTTPNPTRTTTQATTMPYPGPVWGPDGTPHPQTKSSPGPTKRPRKTAPPRSTSPGLPSTPRPVPLQVNRAEQTSSPHPMPMAILFLLYVSVQYDHYRFHKL